MLTDTKYVHSRVSDSMEIYLINGLVVLLVVFK